MWKSIVIPLCLSTILLLELPEASASHHPSRVLVRFQSSANQAARSSAHEEAGAVQVLEEYESFEGLQLVEVPEGEVEEAVTAYLGNADVVTAGPDFERYPDTVCNPNDPLLVTATPDPLWGLKKVRAPEAWCATTGSATFPVAVIDSGIQYNHPDFFKDLNGNQQNDSGEPTNIWTNPAECPGGFGTCTANGIDEDGNQKIDDFYGWDFQNPPDNDPIDEGDVASFHGTHVAGTIAAFGNNGIGVVGMNWQAKLVALKTYGPTGTNQTYASRVIAALDYCVRNNIKLSNNS